MSGLLYLFEDSAKHMHQSNSRIVELDVMRGGAVIGIYFINVFVFGLPSGAETLPHLWGDAVGLNTTSWMFSNVFIEGSMRGLFSMLFGTSALVFLNEERIAHYGLDAVERYYRRTLLLIAFGVVHAYVLLNPLDVLYSYGLLGMFLFPLRKVGARALLVLGIVLLMLNSVPIASVFEEGEEHPEVPYQAMNAEELAGFSQAASSYMKSEVAAYQSTYQAIFMRQYQDVINVESASFFSTNLFDIGGMMLVGMALWKLGVLSGGWTLGTYIALMFFGYTAGGVMRGYEMYQIYASHFDPNMIQLMSVHTYYGLDRLLITLGHIGVLGTLCKVSWARFLTQPLAALGRMALTNYIAQTAFSIVLFYGFGFGVFGSLERYQLYGVVLVGCVGQVMLSTAWLRHYHLGPLEWVLRSLIYSTRQPYRRKVFL